MIKKYLLLQRFALEKLFGMLGDETFNPMGPCDFKAY